MPGAPSFASCESHVQTGLIADAKGGCNKLQPSSFYPVRLAVNQRPAFERTPVACLSITVFGLQAEPWIDDKVQRGFVLEPDVN